MFRVGAVYPSGYNRGGTAVKKGGGDDGLHQRLVASGQYIERRLDMDGMAQGYFPGGNVRQCVDKERGTGIVIGCVGYGLHVEFVCNYGGSAVEEYHGGRIVLFA